MSADFGEILSDLSEEHAALREMLAPLTDREWSQPSRCAGWTVSDVVLHLAQTDQLAIGSARGQLARAVEELHGWAGGVSSPLSVDEAADMMVARHRGEPGAVVFKRWREGSGSLRTVLGGCDPGGRVQWVAGELSVPTLATTRLAETWIHSGDVAAAIGRDVAPTDRLRHVARLAWRTLPYAFALAGRPLAGPVAFELVGPSGDSWSFEPESVPATILRGDAVELCLVAARRVDPTLTGLRAEGTDAQAVLDLVRTYA